MVETAVREVREETGWYVDPTGLVPLGFLHLRHLRAPGRDYPYPHPDFVQLVLAGTAYGRAVDADAGWADSEGWEQASNLVAPADALGLALPSTQIAFLPAFLTAAAAS